MPFLFASLLRGVCICARAGTPALQLFLDHLVARPPIPPALPAALPTLALPVLLRALCTPAISAPTVIAAATSDSAPTRMAFDEAYADGAEGGSANYSDDEVEEGARVYVRARRTRRREADVAAETAALATIGLFLAHSGQARAALAFGDAVAPLLAPASPADDGGAPLDVEGLAGVRSEEAGDGVPRLVATHPVALALALSGNADAAVAAFRDALAEIGLLASTMLHGNNCRWNEVTRIFGANISSLSSAYQRSMECDSIPAGLSR